MRRYLIALSLALLFAVVVLLQAPEQHYPTVGIPVVTIGDMMSRF